MPAVGRSEENFELRELLESAGTADGAVRAEKSSAAEVEERVGRLQSNGSCYCTEGGSRAFQS